jgi:phage terminase large subunit
MNLTIDTTVTFENLIDSTHRVSQHIGGTRSGKTYAILQYLIVKGIESTQSITVVRRTIPTLKRTVIKDFIEILKGLGIWQEVDYNISDRIWSYSNGTTIQFISTDDADKLRGIKSDILFIDEASEIDEESYFQLSIRTTGKIILAFNPTVSPYHWLRTMEDCDRYLTTYKDNPYIPADMIKAIEELEIKNPKYWKIYGKGEYAPNEKAVFSFEVGEKPEGADFICYGLDFGFSIDPTALVGVWKAGDTLFLQELMYERGLVTSDIVDRLKRISFNREEIWCDSAEGRLIEEIYRSGLNAKPVKKGPDSITFGISVMKNFNIIVDSKSQNLINEMYSYQYATDKHGYTTDRPEGGLDHLIDAARYGCMMRLSLKNANRGKYNISII